LVDIDRLWTRSTQLFWQKQLRKQLRKAETGRNGSFFVS